MKKKIKDYEFANDEQLTECVIPDGVTSIGNYAFSDCTSLTSVTIPRGCQYNNAFNYKTEVIIR